jgi:uncharacterized cupredoxin-like copper-binding protein
MRRIGGILVVSVLFLVSLSACRNSSSATSWRTLTITADEYHFHDVPAQFEGGIVKVEMVNHGHEPHQMQVVRLKDGVSYDQVQQALKQSPEAIFPLVEFVGGAGVADPGGTSAAILNLQPGQYLLICFIPSPDGVPHLAKGMIAQLQVTTPKTASSEPKASAQITMSDFTYQLPSTLTPGELVKVVNAGSEPHELAIMKLAPGKTIDDLLQWEHSHQGPPPATDVGGMQALDPGKAGWLQLPTDKGTYAFICNVPDPKSGKAHYDLGMITQVTLQ